jgi:ABC-type branched-subunit amino acid transport system ATPase component
VTARTTSEPAIRVQDLEKSYKKLRVLRGVDFDVARGSIFALLGSNGAGKTTVVNTLSTLLKADAGTATVNGFDAPRRLRTCGSPSASLGSSRPWTRPLPGGRTWCWWPGCGT